MSDPIPINIAALETKSGALAETKEIANQVMSAARFEEEVDEGFNPASSEREQARFGKFKTLDTRRKVPEENKLIREVARRTEDDLARDFNRRNNELPAEELAKLRRNLRSDSTAQKVLDDVTSAFHDPTLADEAMDYLLRTTDGELQENVRLAREMLNSKLGREIVAGRNIDRAAKLFHKKGLGENPTELRELYRDVTGNPRDHNTLFSELSNKYTFDQLQMVVAFLLKGLGFDLKAKGPSIQQAELMRLMTETRNLQSILWVYLFFRSRIGLMRSMYAQFGMTYVEMLSFEKLAKEFIKLVEDKYPSAAKLLKMAEHMGLDDIGKLIVLTQYRDAIRGLSPRLYKSLKHRQDLLLVLVEALEELEEEEEEEEEQKKPPHKKRKKQA